MSQNFEFLLYQTAEEDVSVNAVIKDESIWLTQKSMAELFDVNPQAITKHLNNIYEEGELLQEATCSKMEQVQLEGAREVKRTLTFYNLDAIISVGYRVNSRRATNFRIWATGVLREYITKGYALGPGSPRQSRGRVRGVQPHPAAGVRLRPRSTEAIG